MESALSIVTQANSNSKDLSIFILPQTEVTSSSHRVESHSKICMSYQLMKYYASIDHTLMTKIGPTALISYVRSKEALSTLFNVVSVLNIT